MNGLFLVSTTGFSFYSGPVGLLGEKFGVATPWYDDVAEVYIPLSWSDYFGKDVSSLWIVRVEFSIGAFEVAPG